MKGLYVALIAPYNSQGELSPNAISQIMKKNISQGAQGFYVGGSAGECFLLSESERMQVFETAAAFKAETDLIAHVGAISTAESIRYAKAAKSLGYSYISAVPPFYYGFTSSQIAGYFYDIAKAADLPVLIYNFPGSTGKEFNLDDPVYQELFRSDFICGIKHTALNPFQLERIKSMNDKLFIMNGYEDTTLSSLAIGADGSIGSTFNVTLPHFVRLYKAWEKGDIDEARKLQSSANHVMQFMYNTGLIACIKHLLQRSGIESGEPRLPFTPISSEEKQKLNQLTDEYLLGV